MAAHRAAHRPDAWASPHPGPRRAHQQAVLALAHLGDDRALPGLLTALDTDTDVWRAVNVAGHLPRAAAELTPRLVRRLADIDHSREWPDVSPTALASALAALGDPAAVPALTDAVRAAVRHGRWCTAAPLLKALAAFGTRALSALAVVRPLAEAEDTAVRTAAAGALWEIERRPESAVPLLERLLDHGRNLDAVDVLGRIGAPAAAVLPRLREMLTEQVGQDGAGVPNDPWTVVHVASAVWDIGADDEAHVVVPALLGAWKQNEFTARAAADCLDRMGPAARPAVPRIRAALARPRRGGDPWGWGVAFDVEFQHTCRSILTRLESSSRLHP